jgi:hypothetical protein
VAPFPKAARGFADVTEGGATDVAVVGGVGKFADANAVEDDPDDAAEGRHEIAPVLALQGYYAAYGVAMALAILLGLRFAGMKKASLLAQLCPG